MMRREEIKTKWDKKKRFSLRRGRLDDRLDEDEAIRSRLDEDEVMARQRQDEKRDEKR